MACPATGTSRFFRWWIQGEAVVRVPLNCLNIRAGTGLRGVDFLQQDPALEDFPRFGVATLLHRQDG